MEVRTIKDTAVVGITDDKVPAEAVTNEVVELDAAPELRDSLRDVATLLAGSQGNAIAYLMQSQRWTVTRSPEVVKWWQPCCTCDRCIEGQTKAVEYLAANPGRWIAFCDMEYVQVRR